MLKGDHLVSSRIGYEHHGLYLGNNKVIHYSGFSEFLSKGSIVITSLAEFEQGNGSTVKNHHLSIYDANERVARAYEKLGEDAYNLVFNNCEHFVNWCIFGVKTSSQVNEVLATSASIALHRNDILNTKTIASTALGAAAASSTVAATASSTTAGLAAIATGASLSTIAAPIAVAAGVGFVAKSIFDYFWD